MQVVHNFILQTSTSLVQIHKTDILRGISSMKYDVMARHVR